MNQYLLKLENYIIVLLIIVGYVFLPFWLYPKIHFFYHSEITYLDALVIISPTMIFIGGLTVFGFLFYFENYRGFLLFYPLIIFPYVISCKQAHLFLFGSSFDQLTILYHSLFATQCTLGYLALLSWLIRYAGNYFKQGYAKY